jgi:hypothetical protein
MVMEAGLGEEQRINESSILWENNLLDLFFEEGHIVSNAPVTRLPVGEEPPRRFAPGEALPRSMEEDFEEARQGGADYFVLALLDFRGATGRALKPQSVCLRLFRIRPPELLAEQWYTGGGALSPPEERENVKNIARRLLSRLSNR